MKEAQITLQENSDGELFFEIPPDLLDYLDWEKGDDLKFTDHKNGVITIKKVKYETIELDFDDEELLKYMKLAHDKGMSFNEWVEYSLKQIIEELK
jgi:bifunctional DNA-binding transcriptional regulator/antitoxin component of YhaV-PrlF toxin-antitoxin module|tara:strand:+ start:68 stop:355 length:288 start_codon:yes stop_codon:yes gene_type:complete